MGIAVKNEMQSKCEPVVPMKLSSHNTLNVLENGRSKSDINTTKLMSKRYKMLLQGDTIRDLFFTKITATIGTKHTNLTMYRCRCGRVRVQKFKHSYSNLKEHIYLKHRQWLDELHGKLNQEDKTTESRNPTQETSIATTKRMDYLSWDEYFMSVAFLSAMRSKDPSTQVGACIVNPEKKIVGIGYNGFPNGCNDDELPWGRSSASGDGLDTKYPYVCHAEMNAILNKNSTDVKGCTIYVALFPCNECAKLIIQSGIARVVYFSDKYRDSWNFVASRRLLDMAGIVHTKHEQDLKQLTITFSSQ